LKWRFFIGIAFHLTSIGLVAQQLPETNFDIEAFVEERFAMQEEDISYEDLYESLLQLYFQPLDLQIATSAELQSLYILNPAQIESFINYRNQFGPFLSIYELQAIPDWTLETIESILPFVVINATPTSQTVPGLKRIVNAENAYLLFRQRSVWQKRKGFRPPDTLSNGDLSSRYLGDPNDLYMRFRLQQPADFSMGLTLDKDSGEQFTWDPKTKRYGFNFLSFLNAFHDELKFFLKTNIFAVLINHASKDVF
jgi:hypothetical protein